jgi:hypothetical protein
LSRRRPRKPLHIASGCTRARSSCSSVSDFIG